MRPLFAALLLIVAADAAHAADWAPILRGSAYDEEVRAPQYFRWEGFYAGGQVSYLSGGANFGNATQPLVAYILRNTAIENLYNVSEWTALDKQDGNGQGYGVFAGYNSQWDDVVLGLDLTYNRTNWNATSSDSIARYMINGTTRYDASVSASASMKLTDYGSIRARAGYVMNQFMPYATVGFVVGRAQVSKSATVTETETDITNPLAPVVIGGLGPITNSESQTKLIYGYSLGLGMDIALLPNVFVRGEYEFVQFAGMGGMQAYLNTARIGAAVKF